MVIWEYNIGTNLQELDIQMLGAEGWELVAVVAENQSGYRSSEAIDMAHWQNRDFYFKRQRT